MDIPLLSLAAASYLSGGIPTGYLLAWQLKGIDIRKHGSGNPGAANVYRVVGSAAGLTTLALDALKGFLPVLAARRMFPDSHAAPMLCGGLAVVGHVWTVFLGFRGGKGVATTAGVFAALLPLAMLPTTAVFAAGLLISGHISVGSMLASIALPLSALAMGSPAPLTSLAFVACGLVLVRHTSNIKRLLQNTEPKSRPRFKLENSAKIQ